MVLGESNHFQISMEIKLSVFSIGMIKMLTVFWKISVRKELFLPCYQQNINFDDRYDT